MEDKIPISDFIESLSHNIEIEVGNLLYVTNMGMDMVYNDDYILEYTTNSWIKYQDHEEIILQLKKESDDRERYLIEIASYILTP